MTVLNPDVWRKFTSDTLKKIETGEITEFHLKRFPSMSREERDKAFGYTPEVLAESARGLL